MSFWNKIEKHNKLKNKTRKKASHNEIYNKRPLRHLDTFLFIHRSNQPLHQLEISTSTHQHTFDL